jgi:hypothetical protein
LLDCLEVMAPSETDSAFALFHENLIEGREKNESVREEREEREKIDRKKRRGQIKIRVQNIEKKRPQYTR